MQSQIDIHVKLNQTPTYRALIVENYADRKPVPASIPECDLQAHLEDERYPVIRNNHIVYVLWNQITAEEHRAAHVALNNPCDWEGVY